MSCSTSNIRATTISHSAHPQHAGRALNIQGRIFVYGTGVLPKDFPQRLDALRRAAGLTWNGLADALGVDRKQVLRWKEEGTEPCGGAMLSIVRLAAIVPGGLDLILGSHPSVCPKAA